MTPEQIERRRKNAREGAAKYFAKVKDTPEFKAKAKLAKQNRTEEQRARGRKSTQEWAARQRAEKPEKVRAAARDRNKKYEKTDKGWLSSCKGNLAKRLGVFRKDLPEELVEAKVAQLKVIRLVRDLG
jgi:hypothetical protein